MKPNPYVLNLSRLLAVTIVFVGTLRIMADAEDQIKKSFGVSAGGKLVIESDRGSIEVKTADTDKVDVEIQRKVTRGSREKAEEILRDHTIDFSQQGSEVRIHAEMSRSLSWNLWGGLNFQVRYLITVPRKFNLDLKTGGGAIAAAEVEGEARVATSGGSLNLKKIQGPVVGRTSGGAITLEGCGQNADVQTSGGSINVSEVKGTLLACTSGGPIGIRGVQGDVDAKTSGGSINVDEIGGKIDARTSGGSVTVKLKEQPKNDCHLGTSGGSIDASIAGNLELNIDARTSGGRVSSDLPVTVQGELKKSSLQGKLNGGGPLLQLHTSGGSIHIRKL